MKDHRSITQWICMATAVTGLGCSATSWRSGQVAYRPAPGLTIGESPTVNTNSGSPVQADPSTWKVRGQNPEPLQPTYYGRTEATPGSGPHTRYGWPTSGQPISSSGSQTSRFPLQQPQQSLHLGIPGSVPPMGQLNNPNAGSLIALPPISGQPATNQVVRQQPNQVYHQQGRQTLRGQPQGYQTRPQPTMPSGGTNFTGGPFNESFPPSGTAYSHPSVTRESGPQLTPGLGPVSGMDADIDVLVNETQTGRFMFGVGINSDAGVIGNIVVDERNFDLFRPPRSWQDIANGHAFRGGGQAFRMEALPGSRVQRYTVSLTEPYLFGTNVSFNVSGYFYDRRFFDWDEQRVGGRLGLGYRLTPDLSANMSLRGEEVNIHDPRIVGAAPELDDALGTHDLFSVRWGLAHDTRDIAFAPTEGHLLEASFEQAFGSFDYPRVTFDARQYFMINERPDGSGRQVLGFTFRGGITGSDTPIFENFFAGGFSTLRGFDFRGASPVVGGIIVGGELQLLGSVDYMFPLTADDMLRGVVFVDYGTVERDVEVNSNNFRVAPGCGLRIFVPAMGPAPIALDFAFPIASAVTDDEQIFSFFIGFGR